MMQAKKPDSLANHLVFAAENPHDVKVLVSDVANPVTL